MKRIKIKVGTSGLCFRDKCVVCSYQFLLWLAYIVFSKTDPERYKEEVKILLVELYKYLNT